MVLSGPEILAKLALFPERFIFHVNAQWRISIKGGERYPEELSEEELDKIAASAEYSMEVAHRIGGTTAPQ